MLPVKATSTSSQHSMSIVSSAASLPSTSTMQNIKQEQTTAATGQLTTVVQTMSKKPTFVVAANTSNVLLTPTVAPQQTAAKNHTIKHEIRYLPIATMPTKQNPRNTTILPINQQNQTNPSSTNFNNNKVMKNGLGQPQGTLALATTSIQLLPAKTMIPKAVPTLTIIAPTLSTGSVTRMPSLTSGGTTSNGVNPINGGGQTTHIRNGNSTLIPIAGTGVSTTGISSKLTATATTVTSSKVAATATAALSSYKVAANTNSSTVISLHSKQQTGGLKLGVDAASNTNFTTVPQRSATITIAKATPTSSFSPTMLGFSNGKTITSSPSAVGGAGNISSATAIALSNGLKQRPRISGTSLLSKDAISQLVKYGQVNAGGANNFMNVSGNGSVGAPPLAKLTRTIGTQNSSQQQGTPQQQQQQTQKVAKPNQQQQKQNQQQLQQQQHLKQKQLLQQQQHQEQQNHQKQQQQKQHNQHHQLLEQQKQNQQIQQQQQNQQQQQQQKPSKQPSQQQQKHKDNIKKETTTNTTEPPKTYFVTHNQAKRQRTATSVQSGSAGGVGGHHNITMPVAILDSQNKIRTINVPTDSNLFLGRKSPPGIITKASSASATSTITGGGATVGAKLLPLNTSILLAAINAPNIQKLSMAVATTEASATTASTQPQKSQSIIIEMSHNQIKQENNKQQYQQSQQQQHQQPQKQQQMVNSNSPKQNRSKSLTGNANEQENSVERRHSVAIMAKDTITISAPPTRKLKRDFKRFNEKETIIETIIIHDDDDDDDMDYGNHHCYEIDSTFEGSCAANSAAASSDADYEDNIDYLDKDKNIIRAREQQEYPLPAKRKKNYELTEKILNVTKSKLNDLSRKQKLTNGQQQLKNIVNNMNANDAAILQMPFVESQKSLMLRNRNEVEVVDNQGTAPITTTHTGAAPKESTSLLLPTNQRIKLASFARVSDDVTLSSLPSTSAAAAAALVARDSASSLLATSYKTDDAEAIDNDAPPPLPSNIEHLMMMMMMMRERGSVNPTSSYNQTLNMFKMLKWCNREGFLDNSDLRFELNEFNLVQIRERCEKRLRPSNCFEMPLFERPTRHTDTTVDPLLYLCQRCNYHGPALEFLAPKFCSITCLYHNSTIGRPITNSANQERNDQNLMNHRRLAEPTDDSLLKKTFRWSDYLKEQSNGYAAPIQLFFNPFPTGPNLFKRGMKLEAIDPENCSLFCVCTVADIRGYRLKLSFDSYSTAFDFWINADSMDIFPPGWCEKTNRVLQPPKDYDGIPFDWDKYLARFRALAAPWNLFTHLNSMALPVTNPFKIGMHLEAEDLNDTGKICVATIADTLDERIRVHFDGWDDCYDFWVHISSPYIHPCGWHEGRQQLIVPPDYNQTVFKWAKYIQHVGGVEADPDLFSPREPMDYKSGMKLEVVDQRNPCLIRPATVITRKGYRIQLHLDCWPNEYYFWLEDDSPDLHPIGWCEATAHELESPPGFKSRPPQMPCDINGCRGFGNAKRFHLNVHALLDCCPYSPENWRTKFVKPPRVKPHEVLREIPKTKSPPTAKTNNPKNRKQQRKKSILVSKPEIVVNKEKDDDVVKPTAPPEDKKMAADDDHKPSSSSSLPRASESASASKPLDVSMVLSSPTTSVEPPLVPKKEKTDSDVDDNANDEVTKSMTFKKLMDQLVTNYGCRSARNYKLFLQNSEDFNFDDITSNPIDWTHWDVFEYIERSLSKESVAQILFDEEINGRGFLQLSEDDLIEYLDINMGAAAKLSTMIIKLRVAVASKFNTLESGIELSTPATNTTTVNNEPIHDESNDDVPSTSSACKSKTRASSLRRSTSRASTSRASTSRASTSRASTSRKSSSSTLSSSQSQ